MGFKLLEIWGCLLGCGFFLICIIQWRKKYFDLKEDYDILLSEIRKLKEDNRNLKTQIDTDPVQ